MRILLIKKLENDGCLVEPSAKNNLGDIIINKNGKMAVIEVKSYIDKTKSSQSLYALHQKRQKIKRYLVFATAENFSNKQREEFFKGEWQKDYKWIILQSYREHSKEDQRNIWINIWEHDGYKDYLPFHELIKSIESAFK